MNNMENNKMKYFEKYNSRFTWEAVFKSALVGVIIGFALNFIAAFVTWFTEFNGFWVMMGVLLVGLVVGAIIAYFKSFRPTVMSNARRIDRYGLEERLITMVELETDDSCLARLQRADAEAKLASVDAREIKFRFPKLVVIFAVVTALLGSGMSTVNILAEAGYLPDGWEFVDSVVPDPDPVYVEVTYMVYEGGTIEGDEMQVVVLGGSTTEVIAVPDDGYAFDGWDDGGRRPTRADSGVTESVVYTAIFLPLGESGEGDGDGDAEGEGDKPGDKPGKDGQGQGGDNQNGPPSSGAGGQYLECNQVINGETYYGEVYEEYRDNVIAGLIENVEMAGNVKDFINNYFEIIQASNPEAEAEDGE